LQQQVNDVVGIMQQNVNEATQLTQASCAIVVDGRKSHGLTATIVYSLLN